MGFAIRLLSHLEGGLLDACGELLRGARLRHAQLAQLLAVHLEQLHVEGLAREAAQQRADGVELGRAELLALDLALAQQPQCDRLDTACGRTTTSGLS